MLDVRDAYRLWAPTYVTETVTSVLDDALAREMLSGLSYTKLLDAGCGTGRRIQNLPNAIGLDLSPEMIASGKARNVVIGDIREMPFTSSRFNMVWCRLVLGHIPDPFRAYCEIARVCMPGAYVFVTDFHPDATAAGHRRTLTDTSGTVYEIEHYIHRNHISLARESGLHLFEYSNGVIGPSVHDFYRDGIGDKAYVRDFGMNLVAAYLFRKRLPDEVAI
jgi:malonyl-CoA O-methyltransferase